MDRNSRSVHVLRPTHRPLAQSAQGAGVRGAAVCCQGDRHGQCGGEDELHAEGGEQCLSQVLPPVRQAVHHGPHTAGRGRGGVEEEDEPSQPPPDSPSAGGGEAKLQANSACHRATEQRRGALRGLLQRLPTRLPAEEDGSAADVGGVRGR